MIDNPEPSHPPEILALIAAIGGAVILWFARDVMSIDIALRVLLTVLWLGFWSCATLGVGAPLVRRVLQTDRIEMTDLPIVLLTGAGVLAAVASYLALSGLLESWILIALLAGSSYVGFAEGFIRKRIDLPSMPARMAFPGILMILVGVALIPLLSAPPVMYDALNYHLAFPDHWLSAGGFVEYPRHGFSYYPSSHGMLYTYALATVGPWGASAIHFWFGVLATATAASLGARLGGWRTAVWAGACFALTPAVLEVSTYASADLAVAAWGGAGVAAILREPADRTTIRSWAIGGFLLGCAMAAKYLALAIVFVPALAAAVVIAAFDCPRRPMRLMLATAFSTAVPLLPWLARNLAWTGNPLHPYLHLIFGGSPTGMSVGAEIVNAGETTPGTIGWALQAIGGLGVRTFEPLRQGGFLGPHWLLLLGAAILFALHRWPSRRNDAEQRLIAGLWVFTIAGVVAWGALVQMARFLLPVLVVAAPLAGSAARALVSSRRAVVRASFWTLLTFIFIVNSSMIATRQNFERLGVASGLIGAEEYMRTWISYFPVIDHLNQGLPPGSRVLFVAEPRSFYVDPPVVIEDPLRTPMLVEVASRTGSARGIAAHLDGLGITHVMVNTAEMPLSAGLRGVDDYWAGASAADRAAIEEFLDRWVVRTGGNPKVWVARVVSASVD